MNLLQLRNTPILKQLQIEEALLRADSDNWCILNEGGDPAIIFGISGQPSLLLDQRHYQANPLPLIRRFSGGGTVVTDQNTLFVTFICNAKDFNVPCCPQKIMSWTEDFYRPIFNHPEFKARENDYVFGEKKFGGNAQYLCRDRWLHHSSFLWSYDPENMKILNVPSKQPLYRQNRSHADFLCSLNSFFSAREVFFNKISERLNTSSKNLEEILPILDRPHRRATVEIPIG